MSDDWEAIECDLAGRARHGAYRAAVTAMMRLIGKIKEDQRFRNLEPSVSHASLVFRRRASHSVWVSWDDAASFQVSLVTPNLEFVETTSASEDTVLDILCEYLKNAPLS